METHIKIVSANKLSKETRKNIENIQRYIKDDCFSVFGYITGMLKNVNRPY